MKTYEPNANKSPSGPSDNLNVFDQTSLSKSKISLPSLTTIINKVQNFQLLSNKGAWPGSVRKCKECPFSNKSDFDLKWIYLAAQAVYKNNHDLTLFYGFTPRVVNQRLSATQQRYCLCWEAPEKFKMNRVNDKDS